MKKTTLLLMMLMALLMPGAMKAQTFSGGNGSENSPYEIANATDWNYLCDNISTYKNSYFIMTGDVGTASSPVSKMVGAYSNDTDNTPFSGSFDGQGHTIYIGASNQTRFAAPFKCVEGATIQNVHAAGSISGGDSDGKLLGGFVGVSFGNTLISGCSSSVSVTGHTKFGNDAALAGIVAGQKSGTLTIEGCVFTGSLISTTTGKQCGGILAYQWPNTGSHCNITSTIFAPTTLTLNTTNSGISNTNEYSSTFTRAGAVTPNTNATVTNCYYTTALGVTSQGTQAYKVTLAANPAAGGTVDGGEPTNDYGIVKAYSHGLLYNGVYYANGSVSLSATANTGYEFTNWNDNNTSNPRSINVSSNASYTANFSDTSKPLRDSDNHYMTWNEFATNVNNGNTYSGKTITMLEDITGATAMVGTDSNPFSGIFNGQGHTINVNISSSSEGAAPFSWISVATIQNLKVTGTVSSSANHASGLVGFTKTGTNTIENCLVSTRVECTASHIGGIIGHGKSANITMTGCVFNGYLSATSSDWNTWVGGLQGWCDGGATLTFEDCFVDCTYAEVVKNFHPIGCRDNSGTVTVTISNCYYTKDIYADPTFGHYNSFINNTNNYCIPYTTTTDDKGKHAYTVTADTDRGVTVAMSGSSTPYNVSGITAYSTGMVYNGTIYAGNGDNVSLNLSYNNTGEGALVPSNATYSTSSTATVSGNASPYTLNMTAANTTINVATVSYTKNITDVGTDNWEGERGNYYLIASPVGTVTPSASNGFLSDTYNLYYFDQNGRDNGVLNEWRNYDVASFNIESGKGYLYASKTGTTLTFTGTPYSSDGVVTLSKTANVRFSGWNLVGNPFAQNAYIDRDFYIINPSGRAEIIPAADAERNYVEPLEGIFVIATEDGENMTFSTEEPSKKAQAINVNVTKAYSRDAAVIDRAIVRFDESRGLPKFQLNPNHTKLYIPQNGTDYAVVNADNAGEMPVNFKAEEDGRYTISVDAEEVSFNYLHLIDNMTGDDVDLLATPSYTFTARTTDYASRFKLVFAATGIEENGASTGSATFAYYNGSEWVVSGPSTPSTGSGTSGAAVLQVVDMMGRVLSSETINGNCTKAINAAQGIYVLRLINGENVKVQKIVVR